MRSLKSALVMVLIFTIVFSIGAVAATTIKLSHVVNEQDGFHVAAVRFKELVEERTGGEISIQIHPNAELGDERTLLEGMQMGVIDMGVITNGPVSNFYPEMGVFEMPFLFASPEEAYYILDGPIGQRVLDNLSNVGLKGLAYAERGFRNLTNSRRAVETPEDMDNLKIRVMENQVYIDTFKALGANAIPMAWTEALTALQQGTIDGQENPINVIYSFKLYESQDYLSITRHSYAPAIFVMSQIKYDTFSAENQQILQEAAQEAAEYERNWNSQERDKQLAVIEENGMQVSKPDLSSFQEAVESIYESRESEFGDIIEEIREELANK